MKSNKLKSEPIKTVLVITIGMLIVFIVTKWQSALLIALTIGLIGVFSKYLSIKVDYLWMKLTWILSLIVPNILLSVVFYLMLTPIAFMSRLFLKDNPLSLKNNKTSLFRNSNKQFDKDSFKNPW